MSETTLAKPKKANQPLWSRVESPGPPPSTIPALGRYRRQKVRELRTARGIPNMVDSEPVRAHINWLLSIGFTTHSIAAAAGLGVSTIFQIRHAMYPNTMIDIASRVRAVTYRPVPEQSGQRVPAIGARRRIHALQAIGWTNEVLGERLGVTRSAISAYASRTRVIYEIWAAIDDLYEELSGSNGDSALGIRRSRERGFAPPLAWEDVDIDDPNSVPILDAEPTDGAIDEVLVQRIIDGRHKGEVRGAERKAVIDHAIAQGWDHDRLARSLNVKPDGAGQALVRRRRELRKDAA